MALEISVTVQQDQIFFREPNLNLQFTSGNIIAIDTSLRKVVEIGRTEEEIANHDPEAWAIHKSRIAFQKIYDPTNFNPDYFWLTLWYFVTKIRNVRYTHAVEQSLHMNDSFTLNLVLPDYEQLDEKVRDLFELKTPEKVKVNAFTINGLAVETYFSQRKLASWTYPIFVATGMAICSFIVILLIPYTRFNKPITSPPEILVLLAAIGIISLVGGYTGKITWIVVIRKFIPARLFTHMVVNRKLLSKAMLKFFDVKSA